MFQSNKLCSDAAVDAKAAAREPQPSLAWRVGLETKINLASSSRRRTLPRRGSVIRTDFSPVIFVLIEHSFDLFYLSVLFIQRKNQDVK